MRITIAIIALMTVFSTAPVWSQDLPLPRVQPRANPFGGMSKSVQTNGERRRITVTQNGETIEIEDVADKKISIRHTRTVNGEKKTDSYDAPDFETLKKNHPDAAELYKKHTEGVLNAAQLRAQAQAQLQLRIANGGQFPGPGSGQRPGQGSRQVMSTSRKQIVEIEDQYGMNIVVRLTDRSAADAPVRKIEAANLAELEEKDAEAAGHYKRLIGGNP